jgi:hypothetical protein
MKNTRLAEISIAELGSKLTAASAMLLKQFLLGTTARPPSTPSQTVLRNHKHGSRLGGQTEIKREACHSHRDTASGFHCSFCSARILNLPMVWRRTVPPVTFHDSDSVHAAFAAQQSNGPAVTAGKFVCDAATVCAPHKLLWRMCRGAVTTSNCNCAVHKY